MIDMEISHEEFITILKEKDKYERMKDNLKTICLKCKKNTENIDPQVSSSGNGRVMMLSKCAICGSKKSRIIKHQEANGPLSKLGIKTPLSKIPVLGDILF